MSLRWICLLVLAGLAQAADPYATWAQGRPAEALPALIASARADQRWDAWLDAGLAAAAAADRGRAIACLARAHMLAPERGEPRDALHVLAAPLPTTWCERAGPLLIPGSSWSGLAILGLAGLALGSAIAVRRRGWLITLGLVGLFLAAPGVIAPWLDGRRLWEATVRDTQVLDSTGSPQRALAAGSLVQRASTDVWAERALVRLDDGTLGYIAVTDLDPTLP